MAAAWLASDFQELHEGLLAVAERQPVSTAALEDLLTSHREELKRLLDQPPKNDRSRKKVTSGKVTINDDEYEINQEFIQTTLQLADDLDVDELAAAELLLLGQQEADRLDRTPLQAAVFIFHSRRQFSLESLRLILSVSLDDRVGKDIRDVLLDTVTFLVGPVTLTEQGAFAQRCISSMTKIRNWLKGLMEKSNMVQFHNPALTAALMEDLRAQAGWLSNQHEILGSIIYYLVQHNHCGLNDLDAIKSNLQKHRDYDILLVHQLLGFWAIVSQLGVLATKLSDAAITKIQEDFLKSATSDDKWEQQYAQATCHLWWYTEYNGLVKDPPANITLRVDYMKDIHEPSKLTLNDGALDFLMAVVADVNKGEGHDAAQDDFRRFLQTKTPFQAQTPMTTSDDFRRVFLSQVELFMDGFISNMADLLKEIKHSEEEDNLLQRETTYNLERFFFVISSLFHGRLEAGFSFWSDKDSNLYGFLVWASQKQTPLMAASYCDVLASLSNGIKSAEATNKFLSDEVAASGQKIRRTHQISWDYIFQSLQYYVTQLRPRQELIPQGAYRGLPPPVEPVELDVESTRVLDGYLRLITQIITFSQEAREKLYENEHLRAISTLLDLLDCPLPSVLLAAIFKALTAFCIDKTHAESDQMWIAVDRWLLGSPASQVIHAPNPMASITSFVKSDDKFAVIGESFAATEAFIGLLLALLRPSEDMPADGLPFPETLGSTTRLAGIDPYIDFVLKLFGQTMRINPSTGFSYWSDAELPILQLRCLDLILQCVGSFNEQLIVIANTSNIAVDAAIQTSNLAAYVKLHPFARVMDHLFSESVLAVLFAIVAQGVDIVPSLPETSASLQIVLKSIDVMDYVMRMQHTYLDVVCPLVWRDAVSTRKNVATIGLTSFEDAVLYHLNVVVHLGNYAGAQQIGLALSALSLLTKLSTSPKLISSPTAVFERQLHKNRLLSITDSEGESRRIAFGFISQMEKQVENLGDVSLENLNSVKLGILAFLEANLIAIPNEPSLAHLILGFSSSNGEMNISTEPSGIGSGVSLFHTILNLVNTWDERDEDGSAFSSTICEIKAACFRVLRILWQSQLTSSDTMFVLRENKFLFDQFSQEVIISPATLWNGESFIDGEFFSTSAAAGCIAYLHKRTTTFDYIALELRQMSLMGAAGIIKEYVSSLNGFTAVDGVRINNASIFDLLDFLELEQLDTLPEPELKYFKDLNFSSYQSEGDGMTLCDVEGVSSLLALRKIELKKQARILDSQENAVEEELVNVLNYFFIDNQIRRFRVARVECLRYWCRLIVVILEDAHFQLTERTDFVLQALQTILPKLEYYSSADMLNAQELSSLAQSLVTQLEFNPDTLGRGRASDITNDRLYYLFRVALRSIQSPIATAKLREDFYSIAHIYLSGMNDISLGGSVLTRHSMQSIRASGERLLDILCKDAYLGAGNCKLLALLLLDALVLLGQQENSTYVLEALVRQNFIVVLVQSLRSIDKEAEQVLDGGFALTVMVKATTGLLLRISQTKAGASMIFNAGFYTILRECGLFSVDPDIGIGFAGEKDLPKYYDLVLAFLRVLVSGLLSKGIHSKNETMQARKFIAEIRPIVVSVLKKQASIGSYKQDGYDMGPLVDMFVVLFCVAESVEVGVPDTAV